MNWISGVAFVLLAVGGCKVQTSGLLGNRSTSPNSGGGSSSASSGGENGEGSAAADSGAHGGSSGSTAPDGEQDISTNWALYEVQPAPFAPKIGPTRPSWCTADVMAQAQKLGRRLMEIPGDVKMGATSAHPWAGLRNAALAVCTAPDGKRVQEQTGYLVQFFANESGQDAEAVGKYLAARLDTGWDAEEEKFCSGLKVDQEASPSDQAVAKAKRSFFGCDSAGYNPDLDWAIDRSVEPPEWLRAYQVKYCFYDQKTPDPKDVFAWATCGLDAQQLDAKQLEKEIAKLSPWAQVVARHEHSTARYYARRYEAEAKKLADDDKAWKALLFEVPSKAWKAWAEDYKANKAAIDAAFAYEDKALGKSKSEARGCMSAAWGDLQTYVKANKPKDVESAKEVLMSPVGNVLLRRFKLCLDVEGDETSRDLFKQVAAATPASRGPRHAVSTALLDELARIKTDREKFPVEPGWIINYTAGGGGRALLNKDFAIDENDKTDTGGVIKSVKKSGDGVRVEFKTEKHKEREYWCEDTKKIIGWNLDGSPQYYRVCKEGKMITVDTTHRPVTVPAYLAGSLEAGQFVRFYSRTKSSVPVEVWSSPERKKLIAFLGLDL